MLLWLRLLLRLRRWDLRRLLLRLLLFWRLIRRLVNYHFSTICKCLDNVWQRVCVVVAGQVCRRPSRGCDTRLELLLLRSLRMALSFWLVVQRWPGSYLRCWWRIRRSSLLGLALMLCWNCRHRRRLCTVLLYSGISITGIRFVRALCSSCSRTVLFILVRLSRRRGRFGRYSAQSRSWLVSTLLDRRWQRLVVIVAFPGMGAFGIWYPVTFSRRSSPICSVR